jgi:catechol 2,3-dioxygenase-like lactoylglutathione lyase family enzyme
MQNVDVGFTHVAFTVRCLASSIDFYTRYTATVIHQREPDSRVGVAQRSHPTFRPGAGAK